ncbi:MAG TPA: MMPL family protein, partial [Desulfobulbus sp.]|nr:MMPL family protein [Desulfobulbus sp.]
MINYRLLFIVALLVIAGTAIGLLRLDIDTDVVRSLPTGEKVIQDGLDIFEHHPIHDQVAVDIMLDREDPDTLVECGVFLEQKMKQSGLFTQVGIDAVGDLIPELALYAAQNLPLLLSQQDLETIAPRLEKNKIQKRLRDMYARLSSMEGIGQARFIGLDPLGLKDLVLAKMAPLAPTLDSRFYKGHLLSADGRHLLVTARPLKSGTDTASARKISELITTTGARLAEKYKTRGLQVTLTPVGAYRAALDNEQIIRHDVQLALVLATVGIGLLLLISFPRPLIGLLSLVPAVAGTSAALFTYSLFHSSISIMVLGFGGAIISITVDHGIAYLLFLDRPHQTRGKEASVEVRAIGIMAVITTIGAFLILGLSGFPIFTELGQFAALGIFFSFLFVHSVFPRIFPTMPPGSRRPLPLRRIVDGLYSTGKPGAVAAGLLALGLLFFATPVFHVSLNSMNTVTEKTLQADALFTEVWGNIGNRIFLMSSGNSITALEQKNDRILAKVEQDIQKNILQGGFVASMLFPGPEKSEKNLAGWHAFWNEQRVRKLRKNLISAGTELGFTADAFAGFLSLLDPKYSARPTPIDEKYFSLLAISKDSKNIKNTQNSGLIQFTTLIPGPNYQADVFFDRYSKDGKIFDGSYFSQRLADILFSTFIKMFLIISGGLVLLLFFFYLNLPLTLLTLTPVTFAYICTLGTLKLIGHPLDIPALMLSIIILGMGIDYSIFCVRAHQRYRDIAHPSYTLVRSSVFLAGSSTLIGFGVLCFADHSLLRSIGVTSFTGIGYSLLGTFLLLPPLLNHYFSDHNRKSKKNTERPQDIQ